MAVACQNCLHMISDCDIMCITYNRKRFQCLSIRTMDVGQENRESGASPERSGHCKQRAEDHIHCVAACQRGPCEKGSSA